MRGTNAATGKPLSDLDHLRQSVRDILLTPLGTRVMLPEYGSRLFALVDQPQNSGLKLRIYSAVAEALQKWEPRYRLGKVTIADMQPGAVTLTLAGTYLPTGDPLTLEGIAA